MLFASRAHLGKATAESVYYDVIAHLSAHASLTAHASDVVQVFNLDVSFLLGYCYNAVSLCAKVHSLFRIVIMLPSKRAQLISCFPLNRFCYNILLGIIVAFVSDVIKDPFYREYDLVYLILFCSTNTDILS